MRFRLLLPLLLLASHVGAEPADTADPQQVPPRLAKTLAALHPRQGTISVGGELATLTPGHAFQYLGPEDAGKYLRDVLGYPVRIKTLGMILPAGPAIGSPASWSAVITYNEDGYVKTQGTASIDADAVMAEITRENEEHLAQARKIGLGKNAAGITGWLKKPSFDTASHSLIWATEIQRGNEKDHKLNYFIRLLGRHGVLAISVVTPVEQLPALDEAAPKMAAALHFNAPNRYEDITDTDMAAPYSLPDMMEGRMHTAK